VTFMGGMGSGSYSRWNSKTTTDQVKKIDIRFMNKNGLLVTNFTGKFSWSISGNPAGNIGYTNYSDHLILDYRYRENGGEWQPVKQRIDYDRTNCNYGGDRLWFLCPRCNARIAVLYCKDVLFLCRHCYEIPYTTQYQGHMDNLIDKKHALGKRIFEHYEYGEGWGKKKGMHLKTFNRLHARYEALEQRWFQIVVRYLPEYAKFTD
jgi:hypothetical protein